MMNRNVRVKNAKRMDVMDFVDALDEKLASITIREKTMIIALVIEAIMFLIFFSWFKDSVVAMRSIAYCESTIYRCRIHLLLIVSVICMGGSACITGKSIMELKKHES